MKSVQMRSHVGKDGILRLQVPVDISNQDMEVLLALHPVPEKTVDIPEPSGWPPDFFKITAGAFKDNPLKREAQGEYEIRESLK